MSGSAVLMSIKPVYVDAILAGSKTVELRRRRPAFPVGTPIFVYATAPRRRVTAVFEAGEVVAAAPDALWHKVGKRVGVDRETFERYFAGCERGYGIEIRDPREVTPTPLAIRAPQSYVRLHRGDERHLELLELATSRDRRPGVPALLAR